MVAKTDQNLFLQLERLTTERRNKRSARIDIATTREILKIINNEDHRPARAVAKEIPHIAKAVELVVRSFHRGGRLIYVGAGTSGRLGVLDAAECPPTFGTLPKMVQAVVAGGRNAVFKSREGAEDRAEEGRSAMAKFGISSKDCVCGIAASIQTPFVVGAMTRAKELGARTILVTTNPRAELRKKEYSHLRRSLDVAICPVVGPEVIMGSTRMKSATAQKMVLNMLTTAAMIRLGKVYENLMIDLRLNSRKLEERAKRIVMMTTGLDYASATEVLHKANGHVKTAIVMTLAGLSASEARRRLKQANGFVRLAVQNQRNKKKNHHQL